MMVKVCCSFVRFGGHWPQGYPDILTLIMLLFLLCVCRYWEEKVAFTPESRVKVHEHMKEVKQKEEEKK